MASILPDGTAAVRGIVEAVEGAFEELAREDLGAAGEEFTLKFTAKNFVAERDALLSEERGGDTRAFVGGDAGAMPLGFRAVPFVVEKTGLAVGSGHHPERAAKNGWFCFVHGVKMFQGLHSGATL